MTITPGDWIFHEPNHTIYASHHGRTPEIARVDERRRHYVANGKLLAAAPDLYAAACAMLDSWGSNLTEAIRLLNDAVCKANGTKCRHAADVDGYCTEPGCPNEGKVVTR